MSSPASLLEVKDVSVRFGGLVAVDSVSFSVNEGEVVAVIGPNGAGKTTLFNAITGVYAATSGKVFSKGAELRRPFRPQTLQAALLAALLMALALCSFVRAEELWDTAITSNYILGQPFPWGQAFANVQTFLSEHLSELLIPFSVGLLIGFLGYLSSWSQGRISPEYVLHSGVSRTFQNIRLFQDMSALDNVLMGMHRFANVSPLAVVFRTPHFKSRRIELRAQARELLDFVGLSEEESNVASNLPYGKQRKLEIARALASKPQALLLDEPAAGMNPVECGELVDLMEKIKARGISVVLIEHHMKVVMNVADRIVVLHHGQPLAAGTPDEIRRHPEVIKAYLGGGVEANTHV
jgi:ABC-type branched-subunit amino acid transport system ATPase component